EVGDAQAVVPRDDDDAAHQGPSGLLAVFDGREGRVAHDHKVPLPAARFKRHPPVMQWLMLRGLAREVRHWGSFLATFEEQSGAKRALGLDLPGMGTEVGRPVPNTISGFVDDVRARFLAARGDDPGPWGIFAVSLGGMVLLNWLERYPADFARAVVVN